MFLRAGFNKRFKTVCVAMIGLAGRSWHRRSYLVRFVPSNEYAWLGAQGISWPHNVEIHNFINLPWRVVALAPASDLPA